jgi:hypothetical protein
MDGELDGHEPHIDEDQRRVRVARHRSSRPDWWLRSATPPRAWASRAYARSPLRRSGCETARPRRGLVYPISPGLHEATAMFVDMTMRMFLGGWLKKRIEQ